MSKDTIYRQDAIDAIDRHTFDTVDGLCLDEDITIVLEELPSAQPGYIEQIRWERDIALQQLKELGYSLGEKIHTDTDVISRQDAIEAIEEITWYHQNRNKDMVSGANSSEHQAWYKAEDVYKALESVPSAQPKYTDGKPDCIDCINTGGDWDCDHVHCRKGTGTSAQPEIIRCKDCKHYYFADNRIESEQSWVCDVWGVDQTAHMGFCFKAERRTDE